MLDSKVIIFTKILYHQLKVVLCSHSSTLYAFRLLIYQ